jgi:predicted kinase
MCKQSGRITAATLVDHILPLKQRPDLALAWDNLQPLCRTCHDKKTRGERATPWHLIRIAVTLVCGPPGSGKTTYCRQRMAPGDILIDLDAIMEQLSGLPRSRIDSRLWWRQAVSERNHMLSGLTALTTGRAWVIMTAPKWHTRRTWAERLKAQTVIIEADESTCTQRIAQDTSRNPASRAAEIDAVGYWWRTYQNGVGETVLR